MMTCSRLKYLDFIKGFAVLLVVLGHCIQSSNNNFDDNLLFRYIYSFHMPLFMFVSGFSSCKQMSSSLVAYDTISLKDGLLQIRKRFLQLLVPFFAWFVLGEFTHCRFEPVRFYRLIMNPEVGLWFLWCLFFISTVFVALSMLVRRNRFRIMVWVAVILFGVIGAFDLNVFGLKSIAYYNLFYLMGYFIRDNLTRIAPVLMKYDWMFLLLFIILAYFWRRQDMNLFMNIDSYLIRTLYKIVVACLGVFAALALSMKYITQDNSNKYVKILLHLGTITLGIYACHFLVISPVLQVFSSLWCPFELLGTFMLVTILSCVVVKLLTLNRYLSFLFLGITINTKKRF